ncbi:MAG: PP2C family protein-serine/threonine phosphatase [Egibacteraceae bacterium]
MNRPTRWDAFDYSLIGDTLYLSVFDAMGHDLSAGLIASVGMASCRNARRAGVDLADTVTAIDQAIAAQFGEDRLPIGLLADLRLPTGRLRWINCGYPPPLLIRSLKPIMTFDHPPRPPLGLGVSEAPVHDEQLQPGDRVLFYSDGITEARSPKGALFGLDRLSDFVISNTAHGMPAPETLRQLTHAILDYQQGRLTDVATVLIVEQSPDDYRQLVP